MLAMLIVGAVVIKIETGMSVGEIFAFLTYLLDLGEGMVVLPWTYIHSIRAQAIGSRIAVT